MSLHKRIVRPEGTVNLGRGALGADRAGGMPISNVTDFALALGGWTAGGGSYLWDEGPMGNAYRTTYGNTPAERIGDDFQGLVQQAYKTNGVVFACMLARQMLFSAARFRWQRYRDGRPSDTFGTADLAILDRPWLGGSTQDLLTRMIQDVDTAGNAFIVRGRDELNVQDGELVRLRPDWVDVVVSQRTYRGGRMGYRKMGYLYWEGGRWDDDRQPVVLMLDEVAHWMPIPDPLYSFKGMSWLQPAILDIQADRLMQAHKRKFFEHGATPNLVIKHSTTADPEKVIRFAEKLASEHGGIDNAYKTLNLYPGADVSVVGADLRQIDFKQVQGGGETRIAADAGVPAVIVGLSEGLQAATYSNFGQARRRFADGTIHPLWQNVSSTIETLMPALPGRPGSNDVRLWYDVTDVPFLREDAQDAANIAQTRATTIKTYVDAGFTPESAIAAVDADDMRLLVHTGLVSVQLLPPGTQQDGTNSAPPPPAGGTNAGRATRQWNAVRQWDGLDWYQRAQRELDEERYNENHDAKGQFSSSSASPISKDQLSNPDTPRTRAVTHEEFQRLAAKGKERLAEFRRNATPTTAMDDEQSWQAIKDQAWDDTREVWGGSTIDGHDGKALSGNEDQYAMSVKPPGMESVRIPADASREQFDAAMESAKTQFHEQLTYEGTHLGVFHDGDLNTIDIDPVLVTPSHDDVESIGAYTHAVGGAYHFKSGDGYWPPHVVDDPSKAA